MINQGRSPNLRHVTRTHRVDWDWLFERVNLDRSILIKYVRKSDQLTKGMFTTMQKHFCWLCVNSGDLMNHMSFAAFFHKSISCSVFSKDPSDVSGDESSQECWPDMASTRKKSWSQVAFWINTWPWSTWANLSLLVHKTRGIFLQISSPNRKRRETSCKLIPLLRSWEYKGFVRQLVPSTENCGRYAR